MTVLDTRPTDAYSTTVADLAAMLAERPRFLWMMFERDQQWGGGQQILFLDDRTGVGGGVGFDFDGRDTGIVFTVPGCAAASLQALQDRALQQWKILIPPPP